jgi:hypothetical protein
MEKTEQHGEAWPRYSSWSSPAKQQLTRSSIPVAGMEAKSHHQPNQGGTYKKYATSKAEYTNTQLDLPGVTSLLLYL